MSGQSDDIYHLIASQDLVNFLDYMDPDVEYDFRDKIEDVDKYKRELRDILDEETYKKVEEHLENYMKFNNN